MCSLEFKRMAAAMNIGCAGFQSNLKKWKPTKDKPQLKHLLAEIARRGGKKKSSLSAEEAVAWLLKHPMHIQDKSDSPGGESGHETPPESLGELGDEDFDDDDDDDDDDEEGEESGNGSESSGDEKPHNEGARVMKAALSKKKDIQLRAKLNGKARFIMNKDGVRFINVCARHKAAFLDRDRLVNRQELESGARW